MLIISYIVYVRTDCLAWTLWDEKGTPFRPQGEMGAVRFGSGVIVSINGRMRMR